MKALDNNYTEDNRPTPEALFTKIRQQGYPEEFIQDLAQDTTGTVRQLIRMMETGYSKEAWREIARQYDEFTYFNCFDDEEIVCQQQ